MRGARVEPSSGEVNADIAGSTAIDEDSNAIDASCESDARVRAVCPLAVCPPGLEQVLDSIAFGLLAVDGGLRVLFANHFVRVALGLNDGLALQSDHLVVQRARDDERLRQWLESPSTEGTASTIAFGIERPSGKPPYVMARVLDVSESGSGGLHWLLLIDADRPPAVSVTLLRHLFRLTPTEIRLALALCAGTTLERFAADRHIAIGTARRHLERLRCKTGTTRQAELVLRLAAFAVPLTPSVDSKSNANP